MSGEPIYIEVDGCDDTTHLEFVPRAGETVADAVGRLAAEVTAASTTGCMPTMKLVPRADAFWRCPACYDLAGYDETECATCKAWEAHQ